MNDLCLQEKYELFVSSGLTRKKSEENEDPSRQGKIYAA